MGKRNTKQKTLPNQGSNPKVESGLIVKWTGFDNTVINHSKLVLRNSNFLSRLFTKESYFVTLSDHE